MRKDTDGSTSEVATLLTLRQAATYLNVHDDTLRRWIKEERLPAVKVGKGGYYRIRQSDLDGMVRAA